MILKPDVEVCFEFVEEKRESIYNGYRPAHLILEDYLTTGIHNYYALHQDSDKLIGTITFISPEDYPNSIWNGKKICMYEGEKFIGYATVLNIYNEILKSDM